MSRAVLLANAWCRSRCSAADRAEALALAERLRSRGEPLLAVLVLEAFRPNHFFCEELHEQLGWCRLALAEALERQGQDAGEQREAAGLAWMLGPGADPVQEAARAAVLGRPLYRREPERLRQALFRDYAGPDLPFDQFSNPVVRGRLEGLRCRFDAGDDS